MAEKRAKVDSLAWACYEGQLFGEVKELITFEKTGRLGTFLVRLTPPLQPFFSSAYLMEINFPPCIFVDLGGRQTEKM